MTDIKTDKQVYFNRVKGIIIEINNVEKFPSITLKVGHDKIRDVNLVAKKELFDEICNKYQIGDKICLHFFVSSRFKHERWYTMCNVLEIVE